MCNYLSTAKLLIFQAVLYRSVNVTNASVQRMHPYSVVSSLQQLCVCASEVLKS